MLLRHEQSDPIILVFRPRTLRTPRSAPAPECRMGEDKTETRPALHDAQTPNRPAAVFHEIIWAVALPIGMVLLFRVALGLFLAL